MILILSTLGEIFRRLHKLYKLIYVCTDMRQEDHREFGAGRDFESGAYPTPPSSIINPRGTEERRKRDREPSVEVPDDIETDDSDRPTLDKFTGLLLSVVPPYDVSGGEGDESVLVGSLFLGNGDEWVRINFWGDVADRVTDFIDAKPGTVLEVSGMVPDESSGEILDYFVFDMNQTTICEVREELSYSPNPVSAENIQEGELVTMMEAQVVTAITDTFEDKAGEEFTATYATVDIDGEKVALELHDSHANRTLTIGDTIYIFAGWGKDKEAFIHNQLPDVEYAGKVWARDYSGVRNVTKSPLNASSD